MKRYTCLALALAAAMLAGCGGSDGTVRLGGTITGLTTAGLVLTNGYSTVSPKVGETAFTFPINAQANYVYSVGVAQHPLDNTCTVTNGEGYTATSDITNIAVACTQTSFALGGTITGLRSTGLVLANGSTTLTVPANATTFEFATKVPATRSYGVTVLFQPAGATCTVTKETGVMPSADVRTVSVTCI
ncbi:MAG TPA: hypothetical protein VIT92_14340 [Burkholderiaceae bacterium]